MGQDVCIWKTIDHPAVLHCFHTRKPPGWEVLEEQPDGVQWGRVSGGKRRVTSTVIASIAREQDGKNWLHVSIARPRWVRYEDLVMLKRHWIGEDQKAIQVFPPREHHVNIHEFCLHLFTCLDGDPLPEFSRGLGTI